jgi:putative heme iron utilization protein
MESNFSSDAAAAICKHMNEDHADALIAYARTYGNVEYVRTAELIALDADAMELVVDTDAERIIARIAFDRVLTGKDDARETLVPMAREALRDH